MPTDNSSRMRSRKQHANAEQESLDDLHQGSSNRSRRGLRRTPFPLAIQRELVGSRPELVVFARGALRFSRVRSGGGRGTGELGVRMG